VFLNNTTVATAVGVTKELVESFNTQKEINNNKTNVNKTNEYNENLKIEADEIVFRNSHVNALGNVKIVNEKFIVTANSATFNNDIKTLPFVGFVKIVNAS
jgi:lipopolysaccharide assembly outer membrane protein LptD (OstA)